MDELDDALKKAQADLDAAREALAQAKQRLQSPDDLGARMVTALKQAQAAEAEADDLAGEVDRKEGHERRLNEELEYLLKKD